MAQMTNPLAVTLLPSSDFHSPSLILDAAGTLHLTLTNNVTPLILANYVEQFWIAKDRQFGTILWAYGESGLQVWFPFLPESPSGLHSTKLMGRDRSMDFDSEVYPVGSARLSTFDLTGFIPDLGVVVGLTQEIVHPANSNRPLYDLKIRVIF